MGRVSTAVRLRARMGDPGKESVAGTRAGWGFEASWVVKNKTIHLQSKYLFPITIWIFVCGLSHELLFKLLQTFLFCLLLGHRGSSGLISNLWRSIWASMSQDSYQLWGERREVWGATSKDTWEHPSRAFVGEWRLQVIWHVNPLQFYIQLD